MIENKRAEQKEQTRYLIIDTTIQLIAEKGISATRTIDVAKSVGLAHGSIFVHFPTREDLINSVIGELGFRIAGRMHELAGIGGSFSEMLDSHLQGIREYEMCYLRMISERESLPEKAKNTLVGIQSAISLHLNIAAEKEMERGSIRRMPFHFLFNTWIGLIHHYLLNRDSFSPNGSVMEQYGKELKGFFLKLIATGG